MLRELEQIMSPPTVNPKIQTPKVPQHIVDAYLHQVAVDHWQTDRWRYFASALGSMFWWAYNITNQRAREDLNKHPLRTYVSLIASFISIGFCVWKFTTPPILNPERENNGL